VLIILTDKTLKQELKSLKQNKMNIVTKREVIYDNDYNYSNACGCSGFDGSKATTSQIKDFQSWYNLKKYPKIKNRWNFRCYD
jgi:hypothetical protein